MAGIIGIIGTIASVAGPVAGAVGAGEALFGGGSNTSNSGGTPQTATGGQSANLLSSYQMGQAGNQYLNDASALQGYGTSYASQFFPQVANATQAAAYNPYGQQAISGAQGAAAYGQDALAPYQTAGAAQLGGLASQYSPYISQYLQQASSPTAGNQYLSQYLQQAAGGTPGSAYTGQALGQAFGPGAGSQYTGQALGQAFGQAVPQQYLNQSLQQAFAPTAGGQYAAQALATGFQPNNGLYNQQLQQTTDQSNAINAMYGLSQSPYGAHLTDQNVQEFNNSFNLNQANLQGAAANTYDSLMNQQLATQYQGLQGYGQLQNTNLASQSQGLAGYNSIQNQQLASQSQGLSAYTGLMNTDLANQTGNLNAYNSLAGTQLNNTLGLGGLANSLGSGAGNLYGQGSTLGQGAYSTLGTAGGLPATAYQGLANNSLSALGTGAQNANATLNPYTTYLNSLANILGLGQVGQQNAAAQAQQGFLQQQQVGSNLGQSLAALGGTGGTSGGSALQSLWNSISGTSANPYGTYTGYNPNTGYQVQPGITDPTNYGLDYTDPGLNFSY